MIPPPLNVLLLPIWPIVHIISFLMECCCPSKPGLYKNLDHRAFARLQQCHIWSCSCCADWNCWKCERRSTLQSKRSGVHLRSRKRPRSAICRFYCYGPLSRFKCCMKCCAKCHCVDSKGDNAYAEFRHYHSSCSGELFVGTNDKKRRETTFDQSNYGITMSEYLEKYERERYIYIPFCIAP